MPSQATPLPIVPAAQPANSARGANSGRAVEGFEALVDEAKRDRNAVSLSAETADAPLPAADGDFIAEKILPAGEAETLVAEAPVKAEARPATGSVLDALTSPEPPTSETDTGLVSQVAPEIPVDAPQAKPARTTEPVEARPVAAAPEPASIANASPEPASDPRPVTGEPVPDAESQPQAQTEIPAANARDARIAETLQRIAEPQASTSVKPAAPAKRSAETVSAPVEINPKAVAPEEPNLSVKTESAPSDGEPTEAEILAPLREGRPASERAPGELIRGEMRTARSSSDANPGVAGAKSANADAKPGVATAPAGVPDVKSSPAVTPQVSPSQLPPPAFQTAPLELLLAQAPLTDAALAEAPIDPALSKSDAIFDPAAARTEARSEIRTASTLQFAQGPRLTPQSAQTMAAQIAQRFNEGSRVFDIRMDPPELGRVEVRLEVGKDNSVRAILAAERTETLAELQRSARELERALTEAGLDVGEGALSFSLTDDGAFAEDVRDEAGPDTPVFMNSEADLGGLSAPIGPISTYGFLLARAEGLDVSV